MDEPDYVARAKQLIGSASRTTALVIMPLAAAVSAQAGTITVLPTATFTCASSNAACPSGTGDSQLPAMNGVEGVKFYTNGPVDIFTSGSSENVLVLFTSGALSGSLAGGYQMPVYYDFTLSGSGTSLNSTTWFMGMWIGTPGNLIQGSLIVSGSGVGTFSGTGILTIASGGIESGTSVRVNSEFDIFESSGATDMQVNIPSASTDFNAVVPEPATGGLMAAALAALGLATRFRRKRQ